MSTETTANKPAEVTPETTKAPAETKTATTTEDTAMKTAEPAKQPAETTASSATEKRKTSEATETEEDVSEGVKKLSKLVEEHSDVKQLLEQLSEKNKTNEKIAEVYRKQAAKQFAEGQCLALGLTKGTPEFERRFGEQIQFASQHPQVLEPLMDQIIARQSEMLNLSAPAKPTTTTTTATTTPAPVPPAPQEKKVAPTEKKPKRESVDFVKSLTSKTRENLLGQELVGTSSSASSSANETTTPARSSSSITENWTRVNTSQPVQPPGMGPFMREMAKDLTARRLLDRSQQMVTAKAGHEHAERNQTMSDIVERHKNWQPYAKSFDGLCPDRFTMAMPEFTEALPWNPKALRA